MNKKRYSISLFLLSLAAYMIIFMPSVDAFSMDTLQEDKDAFEEIMKYNEEIQKTAESDYAWKPIEGAKVEYDMAYKQYFLLRPYLLESFTREEFEQAAAESLSYWSIPIRLTNGEWLEGAVALDIPLTERAVDFSVERDSEERERFKSLWSGRSKSSEMMGSSELGYELRVSTKQLEDILGEPFNPEDPNKVYIMGRNFDFGAFLAVYFDRDDRCMFICLDDYGFSDESGRMRTGGVYDFETVRAAYLNMDFGPTVDENGNLLVDGMGPSGYKKDIGPLPESKFFNRTSVEQAYVSPVQYLPIVALPILLLVSVFILYGYKKRKISEDLGSSI
ncbi:MAG: hypothetical protein Q4P30_04745 [Eubacteriales bacterium]|nr:hypothetical protein [Eubacteriales bacterium]